MASANEQNFPVNEIVFVFTFNMYVGEILMYIENFKWYLN